MGMGLWVCGWGWIKLRWEVWYGATSSSLWPGPRRATRTRGGRQEEATRLEIRPSKPTPTRRAGRAAGRPSAAAAGLKVRQSVRLGPTRQAGRASGRPSAAAAAYQQVWKSVRVSNRAGRGRRGGPCVQYLKVTSKSSTFAVTDCMTSLLHEIWGVVHDQVTNTTKYRE